MIGRAANGGRAVVSPPTISLAPPNADVGATLDLDGGRSGTPGQSAKRVAVGLAPRVGNWVSRTRTAAPTATSRGQSGLGDHCRAADVDAALPGHRGRWPLRGGGQRASLLAYYASSIAHLFGRLAETWLAASSAGGTSSRPAAEGLRALARRHPPKSAGRPRGRPASIGWFSNPFPSRRIRDLPPR